MQDFKLVYPATKVDAVELTFHDMQKLQPQEYLNDTLIDFLHQVCYHALMSMLARMNWAYKQADSSTSRSIFLMTSSTNFISSTPSTKS